MASCFWSNFIPNAQIWGFVNLETFILLEFGIHIQKYCLDLHINRVHFRTFIYLFWPFFFLTTILKIGKFSAFFFSNFSILNSAVLKFVKSYSSGSKFYLFPANLNIFHFIFYFLLIYFFVDNLFDIIFNIIFLTNY